MFLRNLLGRLMRRPTVGTGWLPDPDQFQATLEAERMRADRSGAVFSLALFSFAVRGEALERFAAALHTRKRGNDHAGFQSDTRVGVILWNTDEEGAWRFVHSLPEADRPPCEVFVYHGGPQHDRRGGSTTNSGPSAETSQAAQPAEVLFVKPLPLWKRAIDVVGASVGLLVLSPLMLLTTAAIKLTAPGPVFFVQRRDGLGGRPFWLYKFRTMHVDAEARKAALRQFSEQDGPAFKMTNDPRITPIGRYLRKTCIDELPQLWNVLKGDMTLVGPRPLPCDESQGCLGWQRRRLEVTPGLTCIWQVDGKSRVPFAEWMRMDLRYIRARTLWQDIKLVVRTAVAVILHRASQ